jgi:hypothetical protein
MSAHTEGLTAHEASVRMRLNESKKTPEQAKRFKSLGGDGDLFSRLGIDLEDDKINIDLGKTKGFFDALQSMLTSKAKKIQSDLASGSVDLGENVGIKVDDEQINIDLNKTKNFIDDLGKKFAGFVEEIDKSVGNIHKK